MKIVISPAKSLDFESPIPELAATQPNFLKESRIINAVLKQKKPSDLMQLMSISEPLAALNWQRNKAWKTPFTSENARPAVFAFSGEVYIGLDVKTLPLEKLPELQERVRILSGLYGILKPLDLMQPYRLEMGTSIAISDAKNLYDFWKARLTNALNKELKKGELLVNLASKEYFSAIDVKALKANVITPEFKDYKDGNLKMIGFFAKKARGLMVRYIIETNAQTAEDLQGFDYEGYRFDANLSQGTKLVFTR
ncbi:MAG: peroxide stress protein YaaA [Flavobacterium sp.]|nr:peroxide stress protein YaaA [Flavobacterium sp.]